MNQLKKLVPDIVAIVLFAIISVAYFFPAITEGRILAQHDAVSTGFLSIRPRIRKRNSTKY